MQINKQKIAIDLFAGCGGLTLGLKQAGFKVISAIEIESRASETYLLNHPEVNLFKSDIRLVDASELKKQLKLKVGELGLLAGCPPCQGFSRLRTRNKKIFELDDRNDLIFEFLRFVQVFQPQNIMLENVPALAKDIRFEKFRGAVESLGYTSIVRVADASDFGVPQRRKRLILLASKRRTPLLPETVIIKTTVRQAFHQIRSCATDALHNMKECRSDKVKMIIAAVPINGGSRSSLPPELILDCHKASDGFRDVYGRMAWDQVAPTITSGCVNPSKGRFIHPDQNRTISLREAAVLQSFPPEYKFIPSHGKTSIALMIGNALPPEFIRCHAAELICL